MKVGVNNMTQSTQENYVPTLNSMGYMTRVLDPYCEQFINFCFTVESPVADLGVAFGHTTQEILRTGAIAYANDIDSKHLDFLKQQVTKEEKDRLFLFPGKLPEVFSFKNNFFSGVLASRCFHFLTGIEIENLVSQIYKSLIQGGMICVVAETPYLGHLKEFIPLYEERKVKGDLWPGHISSLRKYTNRANTSEWVNLLDPDILQRTLEKFKFRIEKVGFIDRFYFPEEVRFSGKESVGIIGIK